MPLRKYKTDKVVITLALLAVFSFHGGIAALGYHYRSHDDSVKISESSPSLVMHNINLAGVDTAKEVTNQHDDEVVLSEAVEQTPEPEETPDEKIEEQVEEAPKEVQKEVIATKQPTPEAPKVQVKKEVKKVPPKKKVVEAKPQPKNQSKRVVSNSVLSVNQVVIVADARPQYSRPVTMRRIFGTTVLLLKFDASGKVVSVVIERSSGNQMLDKDHQKAAMKVRIKPYVQDGKAMALTVRREYQHKPQ